MPKTHRKNKKKLTLIAVSGVLLLVLLITVLELTNTTYILHKRPAPTIIPTTSSAATTPSASDDSKNSVTEQSNSSTGTNSSSDPKQSSGSTNSSSVALVAPYGNFVSNHYPGQNGSDLKELSLCTTTPGATCFIKFTRGDTVKVLPVKTTDQGGSATWEWNITDAGLTSGSWKIEAIAKLGTQTASTTDQLRLEVQ